MRLYSLRPMTHFTTNPAGARLHPPPHCNPSDTPTATSSPPQPQPPTPTTTARHHPHNWFPALIPFTTSHRRYNTPRLIRSHHTNMRQTHFAIGRAMRRYGRRNANLRFAIMCDMDSLHLLRLLRRRLQAKRDVLKVLARSLLITSTCFNLNGFSKQESLRNFRFFPFEIPKIAKLMAYNQSRTTRNGYKSDPITACCIVLRKLFCPTRWSDVEALFGMLASALSEIFWETVESFLSHVGHLLDFRQTFLTRRAERYASTIYAKGAALDNCVGFIDCTRTQMCRPVGANAMQRSVYSGHKRFHCLIYQTITTPDGLIFSMYSPEVGRRHDMTLYRQSKIGDDL